MTQLGHAEHKTRLCPISILTRSCCSGAEFSQLVGVLLWLVVMFPAAMGPLLVIADPRARRHRLIWTNEHVRHAWRLSPFYE